MPKYDGSAIHRHAIWTVHGEKCYQCGQPVDLQSMQVDHVIPQSVEHEPETLAMVLQELGRPECFNLHGFENLLPCCAPCNRRKSDTLWQPSLAIQRELQNAEAKTSRVEGLIEETKKKRDISILLNELEQFRDDGTLTGEHMAVIRQLTQYQLLIRLPELRGEPVRIVKEIKFGTVAQTKDMTFATLPGFTLKVGTGGGFFSNHVICKSCGASQFSGTLCLECGAEN